jgi:hypothetical protein
MVMTQNASVETVAARTHKIERNDFMLRTRAGYSIKLATKSVLSGEGQELEENGCRWPSAMEDSGSQRMRDAPLGKKSFERTGRDLQRGR